MPEIIGALRGVLGLDSAAFDTGVNRANAAMSRMERRMDQVSRNMTKAGRTMSLAITAPMAAAATAAVRSSLKTVDAQAKIAQSLGTTVKSMQVMERAADMAGVSVEGLETGVKDLTRRLSQASASGGPVAAALDRINLSGAALLRLPLDQRVAKINDALEEFVPAAERAAVAGQLFGEEGSLAISRIDAATLRQAAADVSRFGIAISEVQADQIERTNDAISRLGLISRGIANQLTASLAPVLEKIADKAAEVGDWFNSLSDSGKRLVVVGAAIAAGIGPAALAVGALVGAVSALASPVAVVVGGLALFAAGAAAVTAAVTGSRKADEIHQKAIDNVTIAMGDQIHASARLAAALDSGQAMTLAMVEANIAEARSRRAVIDGLIEQRRQIALNELGYGDLLVKIQEARDRLRELREPGDHNVKKLPELMAAAYEAQERYLVRLLQKQQEMLRSVRERNLLAKDEQANLEQIEANLAALQERQAAFNVSKGKAVTLSERLSYTVDEASRKLGLAWQNAVGLAGGLGRATAQAAALSGFLSGLPGDLAAAQANIAGLQAGISVLSSGGTQAAASVAQYRAQLEASLPPLAAMQDGQREFVKAGVDAKVAIFAQEQSLRAEYQKRISALTKSGGAAKKASRSAVDGIKLEIAQRRSLLSMTDDQRRKYEAVIAVQKRLGETSKKVSAQEVNALADQLVALEKSEEALARVDDLQRQWSENITRTAFEGGSMGDVVEGVLKDIAYQFAHTKLVLPVVASVTSILGLDSLLLGASGGAAALGGGTTGSGLLGGLLGNVGGGLLGGGGAIGQIGSGLGGVLSGAGLGSSFANLGGLLSGASSGLGALGAALPALGVVAGGIAILAKGLSQKYAGTALRGSLGSEGFDGTSFDWYRGGFLRGDKAKYKSVPDEIQGLLDSTMRGVTTSLKGMALSVGLATGALADFSDEQFTIWTNGKDAAQIQAELNEKIEDAEDRMAELVLGTDRFTRVGETASDALTRLSTSIETVNMIMDTLDHRLFRVSLRGADAASALADAFGGLDAMQAATSAYWQAFYSEQERFDTQLRQLRDRFADLGVAMPESREAFRAMVEGISTATESGRELYAELVGMASALDEVLPQVEKFSLSMTGLVDRIGGELEAQVGSATTLARASAKAASEWYRAAGTLRDLVQDIDGTALGGATTRQQLAANQAAFDAAVAAARGGDVSAAASVPALARAVLDGARATAATGEDYRYAVAQVRSQVSLLAGISELQGANEDVLSSLYERQIEVLTGLGNFLQLEGLTDAEIAKLGDGISALAADWDGTVAAFEDSLGALKDAIRNAEAFSYDDLVGRLDVAVAMSADAPDWLQRVVASADAGIRTTLDFVLRRNDLTPDLKWLAVTGLSEHVKTLDFVVRNDLTRKQAKLALATQSDLRKDISLTVVKDISDDAKRVALARDSTLSRRVNVVLTRGGSDVVRKLTRLQDMIGSGGKGKITFAGGITFAPEEAFSTWYSDTTASLISTPMNKLRTMLDRLRAAVDEDRKQRSIDMRLLSVNSRGSAVADRLAESRSAASSLIGQIEALETSTGISLRNGDRDAVLRLNKDGTIAYAATATTGGPGLEAFNAAFRGPDGLEAKIAEVNATILARKDRVQDLRSVVRDLGGIPSFARGGLHAGGLRLVGEEGPELEATGPSRIWSADETRAMLGGGAAAGELSALRREVSVLSQWMSQVESHTHDSKLVLRRIDAIGVKART